MKKWHLAWILPILIVCADATLSRVLPPKQQHQQVSAQEPLPQPKPKVSASEVKVKAGEIATIAPDAKGEVGFSWDKQVFPVGKKAILDGKKLYLTTTNNGKYPVVVADFEAKVQTEWWVVVTGGSDVEPTPPDPTPEVTLDFLAKQLKLLSDKVDKGFSAQQAMNMQFDQRLKLLETAPTPKPIPPDPTPPTPTDPYFPLDGKTRVLITYDINTMDKLTAAQQAAIEGTEVRKWLDGHCPPGGYKIWPTQVKGVENTPPEWQKAWNKAQATKTPLPYVLASNGKGVETIQTIPSDGVMPILTKVGGP